MWVVRRGKLIAPESKLTYFHKNQLLQLETEDTCESLAIFCPADTKTGKVPWQKFWTIDTRSWVLRIVKLNGVAMTISPLSLKEISSVQELYQGIVRRDRQKSSIVENPLKQSFYMSAMDSEYS